MAYVKKTLAPGEDYVYRARFNWTYNFTSWAWLMAGAAPFIAFVLALALTDIGASQLKNVYIIVSSLSFLAGLFVWLQRSVHKWTTVVAITTVRLILKRGLIARDTHEVSLDKIEEVLVHQPFLGRILGYGILTIRGTGIGVIEFPILAKPAEIRRKIEEAVVRARRNHSSQKNIS